MIDEYSIKNKDFSLDLPLIIAQLKIIEGGFNIESEKEKADDYSISALRYYLDDCINNLETINRVLYWPDEPTDTAEQAAETADNQRSHVAG